MSWRVLAALLLVVVLAPVTSSTAEAPATVAVVLHPSNDAEIASTEGLASLFRLSRRSWPSGARVELVLPPTGSAASRFLAEDVLDVGSEKGIAKLYLNAMFQQLITALPQQARSDGETTSLVEREPGAIGIVADADAVKGRRVRLVQLRAER